VLDRQPGEYEWIVKKMSVEEGHTSQTDLLPEYQFDYSKARPNRFALRMNHRAVMLDADVAEVFASSEQVNAVLRALIATMSGVTTR